MPNSRTGEDYLKKASKEHGRRGSGTWPDGTSKTDKRYNRNGVRTFGDGTPVTSKNYAAFKKNKDKAPKKK